MKWVALIVIVVFVFVFAKPYLQDVIPDREQTNEATTVHIDVNVDIDESWYNKTDVHHPNEETTATIATTTEPVTTEAATVATTTETATEVTTETTTEATTEADTECDHLFDGNVVGYDGPNDVEKIWCSHGCGTYCIREIPDLCIRVDVLADRFVITVTGGLHPEAKVYAGDTEVKLVYFSHSRYEYTGFVMIEDLDGRGFEVRAYDVSEHRKAVASYTSKGEMVE